MDRNLKVRLLEHKSPNSLSALSAHLSIGWAHTLEANRTAVIALEKHNRRRKIVESLAILHNPMPVCNVGPSTEISEMWAACIPNIRSALADAD